MPWRIKSLTETDAPASDPLYFHLEVGWVPKRLADVYSDSDYDNALVQLPEDAEWEVAEDE